MAKRGDPWASAHYSIDAVVNRLQTRSLEGAPERTELAGEKAVKYVIGELNGRRQHEWKFEHNGWLFAVGIIVQPRDTAAFSLGQRALSTWQWQYGVVADSPTAVEKAMGELNLTRTIAAPPEAVWTVLRTLEGQAAMRAPLVKAFVVPRRPDDLGERFAFVTQRKGYQRTSLVEVLEEQPPWRLVTWEPHSGDENLRIIFDLTPLPLRGETNVTATVQYTVSADREGALRQRRVAERVVGDTLHRLQAATREARHARA